MLQFNLYQLLQRDIHYSPESIFHSFAMYQSIDQMRKGKYL